MSGEGYCRWIAILDSELGTGRKGRRLREVMLVRGFALVVW